MTNAAPFLRPQVSVVVSAFVKGLHLSSGTQCLEVELGEKVDRDGYLIDAHSTRSHPL